MNRFHLMRVIAVRAIVLVILHLFLSADVVTAASSELSPGDTEIFLKDFHKNPSAAMKRSPARWDQFGFLITDASSPLFEESLSQSEIGLLKDQVRETICLWSGSRCPPRPIVQDLFAGYTDKNRLSNFLFKEEFPAGPVLKLKDIESMGLLSATLESSPWSDSYWPIYKGLLGRRWSFDLFPESKVWEENYSHYNLFPIFMIPKDSLSPAEKYDLLVGDKSMTMTKQSWEEGRKLMLEDGQVPLWMGLCHGWAAAAYMTPNPQRSVTLIAVDGQPITFFPSDIKALASAAWATAAPPVNFVGTRCEMKEPEEDELGRVRNSGCFDINPGLWHLAIVNQIGVAKRSFVIDSTYDHQVWNYPVLSYHYSYFNPQSLKVSSSLSGASVRIEDYAIDKFKSYRSPKARFVVGIAMNMTYISIQGSSRLAINDHKKETVKYVYDLELDSSGHIVGGEWYSNYHPDFIWSPAKDSRPISAGEKDLSEEIEWEGTEPIPVELREAALISSKKRQPLHIILETLVRKSAQ